MIEDFDITGTWNGVRVTAMLNNNLQQLMNHNSAILLAAMLLLTSCVHSRYYRRVSKNIKEFEAAVTYLKQVKPASIVSPKLDCAYLETTDPLLKTLMEKYRLKRICVSGHTHNLYDTAITFHRNYNPIFGKADVLYYDFGQSGLRLKATSGVKTKNEKLKVINDSFIYVLYSKPAFGF